jgi:hypothetical protein
VSFHAGWYFLPDNLNTNRVLIVPDCGAIDWILMINTATNKGQHTTGDVSAGEFGSKKTESQHEIHQRCIFDAGQGASTAKLSRPGKVLGKFQTDKTFPHPYELVYFMGKRSL